MAKKKYEAWEIDKLRTTAKTTRDVDLIRELYDSSDMNIRKAIAQNIYTPTDILDILMKDQVTNVSYHARKSRYPNIEPTYQSGQEKHVCVQCKETNPYNCNKCTLPKNSTKN